MSLSLRTWPYQSIIGTQKWLRCDRRFRRNWNSYWRFGKNRSPDDPIMILMRTLVYNAGICLPDHWYSQGEQRERLKHFVKQDLAGDPLPDNHGVPRRGRKERRKFRKILKKVHARLPRSAKRSIGPIRYPGNVNVLMKEQEAQRNYTEIRKLLRIRLHRNDMVETALLEFIDSVLRRCEMIPLKMIF